MANLLRATMAGATKGHRQQGIHELDKLLKTMKAGALSGDHILLEFDDGSTQQVIVADHNVHDGADGITVNFEQGVIQ